MKKKTKKQIVNIVIFVVLALVGWLLIMFNLNLTETSAQFFVKQQDFAFRLVQNVTDNIVFYGFLAAITTAVYYFAKKK